MTRNLAVSPERIAADIAALAALTEPDRPFTRRAFTPKFREGRAWLARRFAEAGLETRVDAAGNLIGRRPGLDPARGVIMVGSHSDTVPDGGRFDGVAGVAAALEVARVLAHETSMRHALEIVDFLGEEVTIFGVSCVGSRGMAGLRPSQWLGRDKGGVTLAAAITEVGGDPYADGARKDIKAFLELHIEQGTVLEGEGLDIGVVTAISGITRLELVLQGRADHAGTTPMTRRRDALVAAARLVLQVDEIARQMAGGAYHFAATVGEFEIEPNAANVIPGQVRLLIDARAERREDMDRFIAALGAAAAGIAAETGVIVPAPTVVSDNAAVGMDADVVAALEAAGAGLGARQRRMASGAGHDAAWMARVSKAGMIFIPCLDGRSHAPEEHAETGDIALGAAVLLETVLRLDREL